MVKWLRYSHPHCFSLISLTRLYYCAPNNILPAANKAHIFLFLNINFFLIFLHLDSNKLYWWV